MSKEQIPNIPIDDVKEPLRKTTGNAGHCSGCGGGPGGACQGSCRGCRGSIRLNPKV